MPAGGQEEAGKVRSCGIVDDLMGRRLGGHATTLKAADWCCSCARRLLVATGEGRRDSVLR